MYCLPTIQPSTDNRTYTESLFFSSARMLALVSNLYFVFWLLLLCKELLADYIGGWLHFHVFSILFVRALKKNELALLERVLRELPVNRKWQQKSNRTRRDGRIRKFRKKFASRSRPSGSYWGNSARRDLATIFAAIDRSVTVFSVPVSDGRLSIRCRVLQRYPEPPALRFTSTSLVQIFLHCLSSIWTLPQPAQAICSYIYISPYL